MKLQARTDIFLTAIDGVIRLHAPMIELISESGSYIRVGDGIEVGSPSGLLVKVPEVAYVDAASLSAEAVPRDAAEQDDAEEARLHYGDTPHDENGARGATADTV